MTKLKADHDYTGLDQLDVSTHPARDAAHFRGILAARRSLASAEQELHDAVRAAREAGDAWTIIGAALDTTRQAARSSASEVNSPRHVRTDGRASRHGQSRACQRRDVMI